MTQIAGTVSNASSRELELKRNSYIKREHSRLPFTIKSLFERHYKGRVEK